MARPRPNQDKRPKIERSAHLKPAVRKKMEADIAACDHQLANPLLHPGLDERMVGQRKARIEKSYYAQAAPDITPEKRDENARRIKVLEKEIANGMLSSEEMRRQPTGSVDQNIKHTLANSGPIQEWRNLRIENEPDNTDKSYLSVEHNIRRGIQSTMSMHDCRIDRGQTYHGGIGANSEQYLANYDRIYAATEEQRAKAEAQDEEMAALRKQVDELTAVLTPKKGNRQGLPK